MGLSGMIFCTCPDGQYTVNARCRLCDRPNICGAGYGAYCFEDPTTNPSGYTCFCPNNQFTVNKPCSDITTTLPVTTTTSPVTTTTPPVTTTTQATLPTVSDSFGRINGPIIITENMQVAERDQTAISGNGAAPELINSNDEQTPTGQSRSLCEQEGITVAGGQQGYQLHQLYLPEAICIDSNKTIFIADIMNERIVAWEYGSNNGTVIASSNTPGSRPAFVLSKPQSVILDKQKNTFIICDKEKKQVIRWFRENQTNSQILISNINCYGLTMDKNGVIYASDFVKHEVRRWKDGDTNATIVAGGNGQGNNLNQFNRPYYIFVDEYYSLYISDSQNHRVLKWEKGAKEGVVIAGGNNQGRDTQGSVVVGGHGRGTKANQLDEPHGLSLDLEGNIYVTDSSNHRIQKYKPCIQ
ncbi:unnamed protein product [Adineta steineri]|uniref:NHL repeat containing protein n=1 Tax=Adineta steineri TaxID=433720 RepID=A0A815SND4_9BILA|nr:unnamed protein product [Adineta steineri]CAF1492676.1 unnamed protein product [Adineta steineri]CAF1641896.1 unnamed protein product [Adineta steineri]CAF1641901.1 unnamed protein product [Adineta steineri]